MRRKVKDLEITAVDILGTELVPGLWGRLIEEDSTLSGTGLLWRVCISGCIADAVSMPWCTPMGGK